MIDLTPQLEVKIKSKDNEMIFRFLFAEAKTQIKNAGCCPQEVELLPKGV